MSNVDYREGRDGGPRHISRGYREYDERRPRGQDHYRDEPQYRTRYAGKGYPSYDAAEDGSSFSPRSREDSHGNDGGRNWWDKTQDDVSSWFGDEDAERRRHKDESQSNRGRGPANYTRSDNRICEEVNDRLTDDPYLDASDMEVKVECGEVTLQGCVDSRSNKHRAEALAEMIIGVRHVQNNLRVREMDRSSLGNHVD